MSNLADDFTFQFSPVSVTWATFFPSYEDRLDKALNDVKDIVKKLPDELPEGDTSGPGWPD